jgi:hypothetical protein
LFFLNKEKMSSNGIEIISESNRLKMLKERVLYYMDNMTNQQIKIEELFLQLLM